MMGKTRRKRNICANMLGQEKAWHDECTERTLLKKGNFERQEK